MRYIAEFRGKMGEWVVATKVQDLLRRESEVYGVKNMLFWPPHFQPPKLKKCYLINCKIKGTVPPDYTVLIA